MAAESQNLTLVGASCSPNNTRLLVDNNQLRSDCGYLAWCDPSDNICKIRGCRRDEWPFGFNKVSRHLWPHMCPSGYFCPDEESLCMLQVGLGGACQLNRDDECLQNASSQGVKCLHSQCVAINATLGNNCTYENTIYTDYVNTHTNYGDIVSRDNCITGLYCDSPTTQCKERQIKGTACSSDKECQSDYCADNSYVYNIPVNNNMTGTCGDVIGGDPSKPYVYALVIIFVFALIITTGILLIKIHQRQTREKKLAREEYWAGQRMVNEKARLIDGSIRAGTPSLASSSSRLPRQSGVLQRGETKIQSNHRFSDGSIAAYNTLTGRSGGAGGSSTPPTHPLQQNTNYLSLRQQDESSVDNVLSRPYSPPIATLAPSPSIHSLTDTYMTSGGVGSSAVDPFNEAIETSGRNRDVTHRTHAKLSGSGSPF